MLGTRSKMYLNFRILEKSPALPANAKLTVQFGDRHAGHGSWERPPGCFHPYCLGEITATILRAQAEHLCPETAIPGNSRS